MYKGGRQKSKEQIARSKGRGEQKSKGRGEQKSKGRGEQKSKGRNKRCLLLCFDIC
jgi:hypothetical protein